MGKGKRPQKKIKLPNNWWLRLDSLCRARWQQPGTRFDIYEFIHISKRSFQNARSANEMTEQLFIRLTEAVGFENYEYLLECLGSKKQVPRLATPIPTNLSFTTRKANPQWADYRDYRVEAARPWSLRCQITTESPYFRFGFKLLGEDGRVFGDGSIKSHDANMIVHIGRNNWDRPALGITASDIFLTAYMSGNSVEENDRFLFHSNAKLVVPIELKVDKSYCASLMVNGKTFFRYVVPPTVCRRVVVYAWGDREEFRVDLSDLAFK